MREKYSRFFDEKKWLIYGIALFIGVAMGMISPLATTHMVHHHIGNIGVGAVSSSFFLFIALGSLYLDRKMRGKDIHFTIVIGLLCASVGSVLFPFVTSVFLWFLLMSIMGMGISFNLVGIQTGLQKVTKEDIRAAVSGLYTFSFAMGLVVSSVFGPIMYQYKAWLPFLIGSMSLGMGALLIYSKLKGFFLLAAYPEEKVMSRIKLPLLGAFTYGFSETTLITLYPMFLLSQSFNLSEIGYALGVFVVGGIIGAIPITYAADKIGRGKCLAICLFIAIFVVLGILVYDDLVSKLIFSFLAGFAIGPLYPLTWALSIQRLNERELPSGTALFNITYGLGSTIGPFLSAVIMRVLGNEHIFSLCLLLFIVLLIWVVTMKKDTNSHIFMKDF
ncbi:MFS transporter [Bacillus cytotoxicus]|uniref:MFS transporter n=1 Tax=Bacillus cytotoxicus TaxID=580165 RepID=UPI000660CDAA|nr:MFS transporter [Bacillus cytotoxicus]AWC34061.1 MFS transporter [Bacillus cytotoxicus]AWC38059.1 MFS transporter [Bacillus cytotoxicus]AWC62273.1 MFS transporter [Bacillus cytotoxicus]KMT48895.1 transporter [Bacillus cytotoxicus]MDH2879421.1 MFS transporter [Bacillus cytotoxicus]